jgi:hypothetical protein
MIEELGNAFSAQTWFSRNGKGSSRIGKGRPRATRDSWIQGYKTLHFVTDAVGQNKLERFCLVNFDSA